MAQALANNTKLKPSLQPYGIGDNEAKQQTLTPDQIQHLEDFQVSGFARVKDYENVTGALMREIEYATNWLYWLTDENEVRNYRKTRFGFFEHFRDAKYLCIALKAILPKKLKVRSAQLQQMTNEDQDRSANIRLFINGCSALRVNSRFVVERMTLYSRERNITTVDAVHLLCNIYALYTASHVVKDRFVRRQSAGSIIVGCQKIQKITNNNDEWLGDGPDECLSPMRYTEVDDEEKKLSEEELANAPMLSPKSKQVFEQEDPVAQETTHEPFKITDLSFEYVGKVRAEATPRMHGFGKLLFEGGMYIGQFEAGEMHGWGVLKLDHYVANDGVEKAGQTYEGLWQAGIWMGIRGSTSGEIAATRQEIENAVLRLRVDAWNLKSGQAQESLDEADANINF